MIIALIAVSIIYIVLLLGFLFYRRQVRTICRHVSFIKDNTTNMQLYKSMPYQELQRLVDEINEMLTRVKKTEIERMFGLNGGLLQKQIDNVWQKRTNSNNEEEINSLKQANAEIEKNIRILAQKEI